MTEGLCSSLVPETTPSLQASGWVTTLLPPTHCQRIYKMAHIKSFIYPNMCGHWFPMETDVGSSKDISYLNSGMNILYPVPFVLSGASYCPGTSHSPPSSRAQLSHTFSPKLSEISAFPPHPVRTVLSHFPLCMVSVPAGYLSHLLPGHRTSKLFRLPLQCLPPLPRAAQPQPRTRHIGDAQ